MIVLEDMWMTSKRITVNLQGNIYEKRWLCSRLFLV